MGQMIETVSADTSPSYESTQQSSEALDTEPRIRWNVKMSAKGQLYWEFTVRGDSIEEVKGLALSAKEELNKICEV